MRFRSEIRGSTHFQPKFASAFFKNFWRTWVLFMEELILLFCTSGDVSSGFQSLICTWWRHMCYTFPKIHLWCDTCWPLGGQYGSQVGLFHIPATRHWWGLNERPMAPQVNALPTELCRFCLTWTVNSIRFIAFQSDDAVAFAIAQCGQPLREMLNWRQMLRRRNSMFTS